MEVVMFVLPRLRLLLARRPWLYWLCAASCAAIAAGGVAAARGAAADARKVWGDTREVWVTTADVATGAVLLPEQRSYPVAMVPPDAVATWPAAAIAAHPLADGEVVVAGDLAGDGAIPSGWVAFLVPVAHDTGWVVGTHTALFAAGSDLCDGVITATPADAIEVAVPPSCAATVSMFTAGGELVLARTGP
jgi:hypothetical protein